MEEPDKWSKKLPGLRSFLVHQISSTESNEEFLNIIKIWRCSKDGNSIKNVFARRGELFSAD